MSRIRHVPDRPVAGVIVAELNEAVNNTEFDHVDHPAHYNSHPSGVECIDIIEHWSYNIGVAMKYLWRAGLKPGADHVEDLRKAIRCIEREINRLDPDVEFK